MISGLPLASASPPDTFADIVGHPVFGVVLGVVAIFAYVAVNAIFLIWLERKIAGWVQRRPGPTEAGPFGTFQTIADTVKLLGKKGLSPLIRRSAA